jgi:hypothetical protein
MFRLGKPKNTEGRRYYLFPGQGRGARRKFRRNMTIACSVGLGFGLLLCGLLWMLNQRF